MLCVSMCDGVVDCDTFVYNLILNLNVIAKTSTLCDVFVAV